MFHIEGHVTPSSRLEPRGASLETMRYFLERWCQANAFPQSYKVTRAGTGPRSELHSPKLTYFSNGIHRSAPGVHANYVLQ